MNVQRLFRVLVLASICTASAAWADVPGGDFARLSSQYAAWAGGKSNADAIVGGLRNGSSITLVTSGSGRNVSLAGFTPAGPMTYGEIHAALSNAQRSLSRMGITQPSAEQIQAALIGGEITTRDGAARSVAGVIPARVG